MQSNYQLLNSQRERERERERERDLRPGRVPPETSCWPEPRTVWWQ